MDLKKDKEGYEVRFSPKDETVKKTLLKNVKEDKEEDKKHQSLNSRIKKPTRCG